MAKNKEKILINSSEKCDAISEEGKANIIPHSVNKNKSGVDKNMVLNKDNSDNTKLINSNKSKNMNKYSIKNGKTNRKISTMSKNLTQKSNKRNNAKEANSEIKETKNILLNVSKKKESIQNQNFITIKQKFDNVKGNKNSQCENIKNNAILPLKLPNNTIQEDTSKTSMSITQHTNESTNEIKGEKFIIKNKQKRSVRHNISTDDSDVKQNNNANKKLNFDNNGSTVFSNSTGSEASFQKRKRGRPPKIYNSVNKTSDKCLNKSHRRKIGIFKRTSVQSNIFKKKLRERSVKIMECNKTFSIDTNNKDIVNVPLKSNSIIAKNESQINTDINSQDLDKMIVKINCTQKKKRGRPPKLIASITKTIKEQKVALEEKSNNEIKHAVILQKNKNRQSKVTCFSDKSDEISINKLILNNLDIQNQNSQETISETIYNEKNKKRNQKIEIQKPDTFTDKKDEEDDHEKVHNNCEINFNKFYTANDVSLKNNDTSKIILELNNTQKKQSGRTSSLVKNANIEDINSDEYNCINLNTNINKSSTQNTSNSETTDIKEEILDSLSVDKRKNEKCFKLKTKKLRISTETKKKIHEEYMNHDDTQNLSTSKKADNSKNVTNYDLECKNRIKERLHTDIADLSIDQQEKNKCLELNAVKCISTSAFSKNLHKEIPIPSNMQKRRRGRPSKSKIQESNISSDLIDNISNDNTDDQLNKCSKENELHLVQLEKKPNSVSMYPQKRKTSARLRISKDKISNETKSDFINKRDTKIVTDSKTISYDSNPNETEQPELIDSNASDDNESNINYKKKRKYPFNIYEKRKCGRPKRDKGKNNRDNDYMPHHSQLPRSSKKENSKLNSSTESSTKELIACGKCDFKMLKNQWPHHNLSVHNDLGWLKGTVKPDFENDEKLLKRVLFNAIKRRKGNLICEMCNLVKRSVLGYLSHTIFCGKDEEEKQALMATCSICMAVIKPSSLEYHERMHKLQTEEKKATDDLKIENINLGPRVKRKAAEKAVNKISEFTALVDEDKDDKDKVVTEKKSKLKFNSVKKLIKRPQLIKKIPSTTIAKWKKEINIGKNAICTQIGCQFNSTSLIEIKEHYSTCNFKPEENFLCKICQFQSLSEDEIVKHALEKHSTENNEDTNTSISDAELSSSENNSEVDEVSEKNQASLKKVCVKDKIKSANKMFKFIFRDANHTKFNKPFSAAFQWTLEFEKKNYKFNLFKEFKPNNLKLLSINESIKYLPELEQSLPMKSEKVSNQDSSESDWKKWNRFEGHCIKDNPTFFVGGPVWALAWLPIPTSLAFSENISQFLAISTHPTMDEEFSVGNSYAGKNVIQIWDFGDLNNKEDSTSNPKLAYAIAHEGGTVWCLDWCPSGCYQRQELSNLLSETDQSKRMGLLAAACSDGCIRIYSLIFPEDLPSSSDYVKTNGNFKDTIENIENVYPIYNTEPVIILIVNLKIYDKKEQTWQVTKLSWNKEKEHNIIVGGFSNGYIALWDLTSTSSMLKHKRGSTTYLNPYKHFLAHHHAVTMVYLVPQDNKRFLATASLDRYYKFWDLEDITNPRNCLKKSFVTDGSWLNNWCCALVAYDDALSMNHNYSCCMPLRDYTYKYYNILPTNSTSYTISASDFGNSIANGTLAGEVLVMFPHQLIYIRDMDKILPRKRYISVVSSLEVIDFQDETGAKESVSNKKRDKKNDKADYNYLPSTYIESKDRFGLKFYDKMSLFRDESKHPKSNKKILTCEMLQNVPVEQYPFMSVNRVAWNPNAWSFLWLAVGYQNGFVRLISFASLASTTEWNQLLNSRIDVVKSENVEAKITIASSD